MDNPQKPSISIAFDRATWRPTLVGAYGETCEEQAIVQTLAQRMIKALLTSPNDEDTDA